MTDRIPAVAAIDTCAKCGKVAELDAILLDDGGCNASVEGYCNKCFPHVKVVADDEWRPM